MPAQMGNGKTKSHCGLGRDLAERHILSPLLAVPLALCVLALMALAPSPARAAFRFESLSSIFTGAGGATGNMPAGSHPESWTTTFALQSDVPSGEGHLEGTVKDLRIELPAGLIATTSLIPECSRADFRELACPSSSAVGSIEFRSSEALSPATVFLLEGVPGQAAQLGFHASLVSNGPIASPVTIDISISSRPPYGLIASITDISQVIQLLGSTLRLDGEPDGRAFLTMPRSCGEPLQANFAASSWQDPADVALGTAPEPQSLVGCEALPYLPLLKVAPTTTEIASPSGFDVTLDATDPGISSVGARAAADTRSAIVTLPRGLTINPSVATGLSACTPGEIADEEPSSEPGQGCPGSSKLGSATVTTPLFPETIQGTVFLAQTEGASSAIASGPSGSRFTLELVLRDVERGVLLALPIHVDADGQSGRLTATFDEIPQLPISHLELHLNSGPRAPLTTPATCGSQSISYSLEPSSGNPPMTGSDSFTTTSPECEPRFAPSLTAGTISNAAGTSSAFVFELSQGAAGPDLSEAEVTLPPGLAASFSAASQCPEGQAANGDCPPGSRVGQARIAVGAGPEPLWIPSGEEPDSAVYLAGPYKGAPYSLVIVLPGQAGPFDLGTVVPRAPITIDPVTAQASLSIEGLPQIIDGVPLRYRTIRVVLDRPGFIRNPTSCEPAAITGTATAADGSTAAISDRFQAADCAALPFKPKLSLRLSGALGRSGHPAARAVLRSDPEGAAVSSADFTLPAGELLDLGHLRGLCPRDVAAGRCPKKSLLGHLRFDTPLLDEPLEGSVYLRVPRHKLPELVAEVGSGGIAFTVNGLITRSKGRLGFSLGSIPDVPLTEAVLELPGGRNGLIVNSRPLCRSRDKVAGRFTAHNGKSRRLSVPVRVAGCR